MSCENKTETPNEQNEQEGGSKVPCGRPPVPSLKRTLLVCKSDEDFWTANARFNHWSNGIGPVSATYYIPAPKYIHDVLTIVQGEPSDEIRSRFNVIEFDPNTLKSEYLDLVKTEIAKYNQQVRDYAQAIARELPDFALELTEDKSSGRMYAKFCYAKDFSPKRATGYDYVPQTTLNFERDIDEQIADLKKDVRRFELENELLTKYLYLYVYIGKEMKSVALWQRVVMDDGRIRDGAAVDDIRLDDADFDAKLQKMNEVCKAASEPGMFYCSLCGTAKPQSEYGTFYFAAQACKSCCEKNPDWVRRAQEETYE